MSIRTLAFFATATSLIGCSDSVAPVARRELPRGIYNAESIPSANSAWLPHDFAAFLYTDDSTPLVTPNGYAYYRTADSTPKRWRISADTAAPITETVGPRGYDPRWADSVGNTTGIWPSGKAASATAAGVLTTYRTPSGTSKCRAIMRAYATTMVYCAAVTGKYSGGLYRFATDSISAYPMDVTGNTSKVLASRGPSGGYGYVSGYSLANSGWIYGAITSTGANSMGLTSIYTVSGFGGGTSTGAPPVGIGTQSGSPKIWLRDGSMITPPTIAGSSGASLVFANDSALIAGVDSGKAAIWRFVSGHLWNETVLGAGAASVQYLSNDGFVAGTTVKSGYTQAFVWSAAGGRISLNRDTSLVAVAVTDDSMAIAYDSLHKRLLTFDLHVPYVTMSKAHTVSPSGYDTTFVDYGGLAPGPYRWRVDWADGATDTGSTSRGASIQVVHHYSHGGNFHIVASVLDAAGNQGARAVDEQLLGIAPSFWWTDPAPLGVATHFNALASRDVGTNGIDSLRFTWNFGDGASAKGRTASHVYTDTGSYAASVHIVDGTRYAFDSVFTVRVARPLPTFTPYLVGLARSRLANPAPAIDYSLSSGIISTKSPSDSAAGFAVEIDCGGGDGYSATIEVADKHEGVRRCPAPSPQPITSDSLRIVRVRVQAASGAESVFVQTLHIRNAPPQIDSIVNVHAGSGGAPTTFDVWFHDAEGSADGSWYVDVDLNGDGVTDQRVLVNAMPEASVSVSSGSHPSVRITDRYGRHAGWHRVPL